MRWPERLGGLFDKHQAKLFRLSRRLCFDAEDARDLVQETFLRAARKPAAVPAKETDAEAWLVTVLVNLARDRQRSLAMKRRNPIEGASFATPLHAADPEAATVASQSVHAALRLLSTRRRAVIVMRDLEELSVARVAQLLSISPVTVRWHHAAGRRELSRLLAPSAQLKKESR